MIARSIATRPLVASAARRRLARPLARFASSSSSSSVLTPESIGEDGVSLAVLDDGKANSYGLGMIAEVNGWLDDVERDDAARAAVLSGNAKFFSAGFDLSVMTTGTPDDVFELVVAGAELCTRMYAFPKPVVAASTGHCMALGAIMTLACDYRVGADGKFTIDNVNMSDEMRYV